MRPATLRRILLTQAIEKSDAESEVLPASVRSDATREAARTLNRESGTQQQQGFFAARAGQLIDHITTHFPDFRRQVPPSRRLRFVVPGLLVTAIIAGWFSQALGEEKLINILSFPLLGILGWNFLIYLLEAYRGFANFRLSNLSEPPAPGFLVRFVEGGDPSPALPAALHQGYTKFQRQWSQLTEPVTTRRLRSALHLSAALLAAAAVAGMYAKGAANEYRAYWESTFFNRDSLQSLLQTIFGPASVVTDIAVPDVGPLHRTAKNPSIVGENAAQWIHLYAVTIGLFVLIPRLVLAGWHGIRARKIEASIDPRALTGTGLYFDRLLAEALGTALVTGAIPYCHQLSPTAEASLTRGLERLLDVPVSLDWKPKVSLGNEDDAVKTTIANPESLPAHLVLCFDFAVTPEEESHGDFIRGTRKALSEIESETRLHVCLDAEGFDESRRNLPDFAERREDRLDAWRSIAGPLRDEVYVFPALD